MGKVEEVKCDHDTLFTVMKTSLFFAGDGFSVYDSDTRLAFRVDSYSGAHRELVLMDPHGRCLFTLRPKRPSLHHRWEGYAGEFKDGSSNPIFSVRRSSMLGSSEVTVEMLSPPGDEYQIGGSFAHRSCTVYHASSRAPLAEIRRKVGSSSNVVLDKDVFVLCVKPGFDATFAMALVLVLDQLTGGKAAAAELPLRETP